MFNKKKLWSTYGLVLLVALGFRLAVALRLQNDDPDDGRVYSQIARNVLEQHVYSSETQAPYAPSLIRLPGYPLFLASVYSVAGHGNNTAVRIVQALLDTATCALIALVAFLWMPDEALKHMAGLAGLALAAVCPFTTIYVSVILTEVSTNFLAVLLVLLATLAFEAVTPRRALPWWLAAGFTAGLAVLFRPDSGLFAAAVGLTIVCSAMINGRKDTAGEPSNFIRRLSLAIPPAAVFSVAFCLVLVPWTIRNHRVFHLFQPLAPVHGEMPGAFVPRGYLLWLRTWLHDERYIERVLWTLGTGPIKIDQFPDDAFDSGAERDRVESLLKEYNHPRGMADSSLPAATESRNNAAAIPSSSGKPPNSPGMEPSPSTEEGEGEDEESSDDNEPTNAQEFNGGMTPELDAAFAEIGRERISRAPLRYYFILPLERAGTLWLDTHSQYYPFEGELWPLEDLDHTIHQQFWLPLFAALSWVYSVLGVIAGWMLWRSRDVAARRWVLLAALLVFLRLGFFSTLENPEPRYTVEIFPFLSILGGISLTRMALWLAAFRGKLKRPASKD
jgi:hypothetical protein